MFTQTNESIAWRHIKRSRIDLLAYLQTLTEEQWNTQSLCDGWRVRDVVGHLILEYHYTPRNSWKDFILSGFRMNEFMKQTAIKCGTNSTSDLIEQFQSIINEQHRPDSVSTLNVLVDLMIHEQDIRIPIGNTKDMDMESLKLIFKHWEPSEYNFGEKITGLAARLKGLKFIITDFNLTKGKGDEVVGNAQDVLMAAAGRTVTLDRLSGNGATILKARSFSTV